MRWRRGERPAAPPAQAAPAQSVLDFVQMSAAGEDLRKRRSKSFGVAPAQRLKAHREMEQMAATGDWSEATGRHLVALYAMMHLRVYAVAAAELDDSGQYGLAAKAANGLMAKHFDGSPGAVIEFMRWAWKREVGREKWRKEKGASGSRMGWRLQFAASLVTDYRVDSRRR